MTKITKRTNNSHEFAKWIVSSLGHRPHRIVIDSRLDYQASGEAINGVFTAYFNNGLIDGDHIPLASYSTGFSHSLKEDGKFKSEVYTKNNLAHLVQTTTEECPIIQHSLNPPRLMFSMVK